jgi:hypothetical protein
MSDACEATETSGRPARGTATDGGITFGDEDGMGVFEIMWKDGGGQGPLRRLAFEANETGFAYIREQVSAWSAAAAEANDQNYEQAHHHARSMSADGVAPLLQAVCIGPEGARVGQGGAAAAAVGGGGTGGGGGGGGRRGGRGGGVGSGGGGGGGGDSGENGFRRTQSDLVGAGGSSNGGGGQGQEGGGGDGGGGGGGGGSGSSNGEGGDGGGGGGGGGEGSEAWETATSVLLYPGPHNPRLSEASAILSGDQVRSIVSALPARCRLSNWKLEYSSRRDGISLRSMYRAAAGKQCSGECVLVVRDTCGHSFGAFTSETWRVAPRYYGTGESFVFSLGSAAAVEPQCVAYRQGLTLVHFSAQVERFQWNRGCAQGLYGPC